MAFWTHVQLFGHAVLAVDFFFVLSGFVIAHAYEDKLKGLTSSRLTLSSFLSARAIRLYPMILFAALLGGAAALWMERPDGMQLPKADLWVFGITAALAVPAPPFLSSDTFPLSPPEWSLFFELAANIVFAVILFRLRNAALAIIEISCLAIYVLIARQRGMNFGFVWSGFEFGFVRVALPFVIGMGVKRARLRTQKWRLPGTPPLLAIVLLGFLGMPVWLRADWLFWTFAVVVIFPGIVIAAAIERRSNTTSAISRFSADLSYPLYLIHYPILMIAMPALINLLPNPGVAMVVARSGIIVLAWIVSIGDARVRARLRALFRRYASGRHNRLDPSTR